VSHLDNAILRRYLDEPGALLSYEKEHLLQCAGCRSRLELYRERATYAATMLQIPAGADVEAAHRRILAKAHERAPQGSGSVPIAAARFTLLPRALPWAGAFAAVFALLLVLGYSPVRGYAQNFLTIFEPHQFQPIGISAIDVTAMHALPELNAFGTMRRSGKLTFTAFSDAANATRFAKQPILKPAYIPEGITDPARYRVSGTETVSFTFSAAKARAAAVKSGATPLAMPAEIDGSTLSATLGPVIITTYGALPVSTVQRDNRDGMPKRLPKDMLVISQAPAPRVNSSGATVAQIEAYLLAQPGLSPGLVAQIKAIGDPSTTLPVPVRIDKATAQNVTINGAPGLLVGDNTGVGSVLVWQAGGTIHCVAGPYGASQILQVANSMTP
jgi:hypothetical protein